MTMAAARQKPTTYDQLYPGRFLKAGELLGRKVTLTIADVDLEELEGDRGKIETKCIISFRETKKKLVACKTNGICIREMFGRELAAWMGKRIIIFPDVWNGEPCIRVWGSPDLAEEKEIEVKLPRRGTQKKRMHTSAGNGNGGGKKGAAKSAPADEYVDPGPPDDFESREPGTEG